MNKETERNINRYIRYRLGPPRFMLGFAACLGVGLFVLTLLAYFLGDPSRPIRW
jgi:hypothetical protein